MDGRTDRQTDRQIEHYGIYIQPLSVKFIILKEEKLECLDIFKTPPEPVAKNATLGHPAGNQTRHLANLAWCSANRATETVAESMATHESMIQYL